MTATNVQVYSELRAGGLKVDPWGANLVANTFTGMVGIGKIDPGASLDVTGNVFISSSLEVGTSANLFANTLTGNVGIGTTTPQKTLEVVGSLRMNDGTGNVSDINTGGGTLIVSTSIKANGTLLSFTGQHICFPEGQMSRGLVVSANHNRYLSLNGPIKVGIDAIQSSESLPVVSLSNVANDRSVFGVVDRFEGGGIERTQTIGIGKVSVAKEVGDNRVIVNSLGEGALWVANTNGNLVSGDYLTTSSLPGYAQKQDSDSLKNSTVAKITMDCDFSPRDLPVQVIKRNENGENDLDVNGRFQWEDHLTETKKAYKIRYLDVNGRKTVEANTVHKAAFVGCTYHCG